MRSWPVTWKSVEQTVKLPLVSDAMMLMIYVLISAPSSQYVISLRAYNNKGSGQIVYETVYTREETSKWGLLWPIYVWKCNIWDTTIKKTTIVIWLILIIFQIRYNSWKCVSVFTAEKVIFNTYIETCIKQTTTVKPLI